MSRRAPRGRSEVVPRALVSYPAALCTIWVAMVIAVNPIGDFPLNDDWAWGQAVKTLYEEHVLRIPAFAGMSLIAQILWGYVVCLPFGFSFSALRLASAAFGLAVVLSTYALARQAGATGWLAFLCAFAMAANPLIFEHSLTFMTDTPFLAFVLLSMACFVHTVRTGTSVTAALAIVFALAATLTRQFGVVLPLLVLTACLLSRTLGVRNLVLVILAAIVVHGGLRLYEDWLRSSGQLSPNYNVQGRDLLALLRNPSDLTKRALTIGDGLQIVLTYVGFFLLPVLVVILPLRRKTAKVFLVAGAALAIWFAWTAAVEFDRRGWSMPFNPNHALVNLGVGPITLTDVRVRHMPHLPSADLVFWWRVTRIGLAGGALVVVLVVVTGLELLTRRTISSQKPGKFAAALAFAFAGSYGLIMVLMPYDRYFIPLFPMILIAAVWGAEAPIWTSISRLLSAIAFLGLLLLAGFSVAATHDYLAWNRVRWEALHQLMNVHGVTPSEIDGGIEFNGTYLYGVQSRPDKSPFWVQDDRYMLTFGPMPGYRTFSEHRYPRWIPPGQGTVFVLVRGAS